MSRLLELVGYSNSLIDAELQLKRAGLKEAAALVGRAVANIQTRMLDEVPNNCRCCLRPFSASTAKHDFEHFCSSECEAEHLMASAEYSRDES